MSETRCMPRGGLQRAGFPRGLACRCASLPSLARGCRAGRQAPLPHHRVAARSPHYQRCVIAGGRPVVFVLIKGCARLHPIRWPLVGLGFRSTPQSPRRPGPLELPRLSGRRDGAGCVAMRYHAGLFARATRRMRTAARPHPSDAPARRNVSGAPPMEPVPWVPSTGIC